jgi:fructose-specific phosphotransferase system IIA component
MIFIKSGGNINMATLERSGSVSVAELLSEDLIEADLKAKNRDEVFEQLVSDLAEAGKVDDPKEALRAVKEREDILSTGIGNGVAIPHGKTPAVDNLVAAFGRVKEGIDFQSLDGKPVHLVFLLISPQKEAGLHVRALARISRMLKNIRFRNLLQEAETSEEILNIIKEQEEQQ